MKSVRVIITALLALTAMASTAFAWHPLNDRWEGKAVSVHGPQYDHYTSLDLTTTSPFAAVYHYYEGSVGTCKSELFELGSAPLPPVGTYAEYWYEDVTQTPGCINGIVRVIYDRIRDELVFTWFSLALEEDTTGRLWREQ